MPRLLYYSLVGLLLLFTFNNPSQAQPFVSFTLIGPDTVCSNSTENYWASVSGVSSGNAIITWDITQGNIALAPFYDQRNILWGAPGTGKVIVYLDTTYTDSFGTHTARVDTISQDILILPLPSPSISTDNRVACEPLFYPGEYNPPGQFRDSGCQKVCAFSTAIYTASGAPGSTFIWNVLGAGSFTSSGNTCTVIWGTPGAGKVTVTEISSNGCEGVTSNCIEIVESPIAHFVAMPDTVTRNVNICRDGEVIFLDRSVNNSTSPVVSWHWDFGDGTFSDEKSANYMPVTHKYSVTGTHIVKLTVTNECGCSTTDSIVVNVSPATSIAITCPRIACEGGTYNYRINATCASGTWQVIGGTMNSSSSTTINVTWNAVGPDGFGYIVYTPGSCPGYCPFPVSIKIPIIKAAGTINGPDYLCVGKQYIYRMPQWPTTKFSWSCANPNVTLQATDQPNEIVLTPNTATGTITLQCQYTNTLLGCSGIASKTIQIPAPVTVSGPTHICDGGEFSYTLYGPNASTGKWKLVDPFNNVQTGGPNNTFGALFDFPGTYLLTVTGSFCAPDPLEIRVVPSPPQPEGILGPLEICRGVPAEYTAGTIDAANVFVWSVTNGTVNSAVGEKSEITLNTTSTGPFTINVRRETKELPHCQSTALPFTISLPNVVFSVGGETNACPSQTYTYWVPYTKGEAYDWSIYPEDMGSVTNGDFINTGQGTKQVDVLWNKKPGIANVICRIRKCNTYYYDTLQVTIKSLDVHMTLTDSVCLFDLVTAQMDETTGGVTWFTGIEKIDDTGSITYVYKDPITNYTKFYVTGTVHNPYGCGTSSEARDSVIVVPAPITTITPDYYLICDSVTSFSAPFTISYDPAYPAPTSYEWGMNGSIVSTGSSYTATDTGHISINIASAFGCPAMRETSVYKYDCRQGSGGGGFTGCPSMEATVHGGINSCGELTFTSTHSTPFFYSAGWISGNPDSTVLVSYTDSTATYKALKGGWYTFRYVARYTNVSGGLDWPKCEVYADTTVLVPYIPYINIIPECNLVSGKRSVKLINNTAYKIWLSNVIFIVDGDTIANGTSNSISYPVTQAANHNFKMIVSGSGYPPCMVDTTMFIPILPEADFDFERHFTCEKDAAVSFFNQSNPYYTNLSNLWNFDDLSENTQGEPQRVFNDANNSPFSVKLIVADRWGCKDSVTHDVDIVPDNLGGRVEITPPYPCEHTSALARYIKALPNDPISYNWKDMDKNPVGVTSVDNIAIYKSGGYYTTVKDVFGCYQDTDPDTVLFTKIPRAYIYGSNSQCINIPFTLSGYVGQVPGLTYQWLLSGAVIAGATTDRLTQDLNATGDYHYKVITTVPNPGGGYCSDTSDDFVVTVHRADTVTARFFVQDCNNYTLRLEVRSDTTHPDPAGTYNWSNGTFGTVTYVHYGGPFQLRYTDQYGCASKTQIQTPKDLREYLWIFPTGCFSLCYAKPNIITGPIISFTEWHYRKNGINLPGGGSGYFSDYNLNTSGPGSYTMFLRNDYCNVTSRTMDVDFNCSEPLVPNGLGTLDNTNADMSLAPNPASNSTRVSYNFGGDGPVFIEVYDAVGRVLLTKQLIERSGSFDVGLENFTPGMYKVVMRKQGYIMKHRLLSVTR